MLGIIKSDVRYEVVASEMKSILSDDLSNFYGIDSLLLPLGGIDDYYNIKQSKLNILDILNQNSIEIIITGNANKKLRDLCLDRGIRLIELLQDYDFVMENAKLTAMGIVDYLNSGDNAVCDYKILLLGYGNISYYLSKFLNEYGTDYSIYPNSKEEEKFIRLSGNKIADFDEFDICINTIPKNIDIDYNYFKNKKIIDVASFPYGFDIERINMLGIDYKIYSSIPSKFSPVSAGKIIKKVIEKNL